MNGCGINVSFCVGVCQVHPPVGIAHLEVSAMEREGLRDAPEEECDLHELTFTPVHAPVITLGTHTSGFVSHTHAHLYFFFS